MGPVQDISQTRSTVLRQAASFLTPYKFILLLAVFLMLGESALSLATPWLAGQFTKAFLNDTIEKGYSINQILLLWLVVLALQGLLTFGNRLLTGYTGESILFRLRIKIYDHLQALPLSYFHDRKRGDVLTTLTNDADIISDFLTGTLLPILPQLLILFGGLFFIFLTDPVIALLVATLLPAFYIITRILGRKIRPITKAMIDAWSKTFSILEENLQLLPVIKSFNREKIESRKFKKSSLHLFNLTNQYLRIQSMLSPLTNFVASAAVLMLLWAGSIRLGSGQIAIDQLVSILLYGMLITRPIGSLADVYGQIQRARGSAERLTDVFSSEVEDANNDKPALVHASGEIEFSKVGFNYDGGPKILKGVSFTIAAGETVAITGDNGAGKSTLVYLLQRFADPQVGSILINGTDISQVSLSSLRQQTGVVSQQILLLNGSIRENILFGRDDASQHELEVATTNAHAIEFINQLPQGFDTLIGDEGIRLSGGQKQRLALARALLKDSPILILDEATAMFDPEGEKSFIEDCHEILHQRTVIFITHRPTSLALADRIIHLEDGQIQNPRSIDDSCSPIHHESTLEETPKLFELLVRNLFTEERTPVAPLTSNQEDQFFDWLGRHGFAPLFLFHLPPDELHSFFSANFCQRIRSQAKQVVLHDLESTNALKSLLDEFEKRDIEYIVMKGAALAYRHYARAGLRPRGDTDLLVPEEQVTQLNNVLSECGYSQVGTAPGNLVTVARVYTKPLRFELSHIVDLHSAVTSTHGIYREVMSYNSIAGASILLPALTQNSRCMNDSHALIHACFHAAQHYSHLGERLIWLYDIHLLLANINTQDFKKTIELAKSARMLDLFTHQISRSRYWFASKVSPTLQLEMKTYGGDNSLEMLENNLQKGIAIRAFANMRDIVGIKDQTRYLLQRLFPPPGFLLETSHFKSPLMIPLLYCRRVLIAAHLAWTKLKSSGST